MAWRKAESGMSEAGVISDRFWSELKSDVAGTLSDEQRGEIQRALENTSKDEAGSQELSDLRLSFKWFFVRLIWGPEKRSADRIKKELEMHPPMARRNLPMLASLFAGYMGLWYVALIVTTAVFYFMFA